MKGPNILTSEIESYCSKLVSESLDLFYQKNLPEDDILDALYLYGDLFSQPYLIGLDKPGVKQVAPIPSARMLLTKAIDKRLESLKRSSGNQVADSKTQVLEIEKDVFAGDDYYAKELVLDTENRLRALNSLHAD